MDDDEDINLRLNERMELINRNDPSVTKFELEYYEGDTVTEDQMVSLFHGLRQNTHVQKLDLHCTPDRLRRTVCTGLLPELLRENSSIEYLRFPSQMSHVEFLPSVDLLCNNNNMTVKDLGMDDCDIRGHEGGEMIGRLIRNNHHITKIDLLCNYNLGSAGALRIAAALGDENRSLKALYLYWCGIGDEGVDALCTALQVNNSLQTIGLDGNEITDEGYRTLARSLPRMRVLQEIGFEWEQRQVSVAVLQEMMDSLQKNQSLQRIVARPQRWRQQHLSEEQCRKWETCCTFVCTRNKMNRHLDEVRDAARDGRVAPTPIPIGPLLLWCRHHEDAEVQDSLVFHVLRSNADETLGWADAAAEDG